MARPREGETYTLTGEAIGVGPGSIASGTKMKVRELVPADVKGAHTDTEDAVVMEFEEPTLGVDDKGEPVIGSVTRAVSFGLDFFADNFQKGA